MGLFDKLAGAKDYLEKNYEKKERLARISYGSELYSAREKTNDPEKKREINKKIRENNDRLNKLRNK